MLSDFRNPILLGGNGISYCKILSNLFLSKTTNAIGHSELHMFLNKLTMLKVECLVMRAQAEFCI